MNIEHCPSCLKKGYTEFCPQCRNRLFNGKRVSPILPFSRPDYNQRKIELVGRLSISGVQSKHSVKLTENELQLTEDNGEFIIKPVMTGGFDNMEFMPANEHFTMQLARQVYKISTAECALVFFRDDLSPAYLTKRFDVSSDGHRIQQEDFAQIANMSEETHGKNYKYDYSYEKIAKLMIENISTYAVEIEKFYKIILFNHLVNNGDAHLKNFSLLKAPDLNSYVLTPAYDLLNTRLHLPTESEMAIDLFDDDFKTESFNRNGYFSRDDFEEFGIRIGILNTRVCRIIDDFIAKIEMAKDLLSRSFLDAKCKFAYSEMIDKRITALQYSYKNSEYFKKTH
jgi:serine/threonine-protein kinase HipA